MHREHLFFHLCCSSPFGCNDCQGLFQIVPVMTTDSTCTPPCSPLGQQSVNSQGSVVETHTEPGQHQLPGNPPRRTNNNLSTADVAHSPRSSVALGCWGHTWRKNALQGAILMASVWAAQGAGGQYGLKESSHTEHRALLGAVYHWKKTVQQR